MLGRTASDHAVMQIMRLAAKSYEYSTGHGGVDMSLAQADFSDLVSTKPE